MSALPSRLASIRLPRSAEPANCVVEIEDELQRRTHVVDSDLFAFLACKVIVMHPSERRGTRRARLTDSRTRHIRLLGRPGDSLPPRRALIEVDLDEYQ